MTVFFDKARGQWCYDFQLNGERHRGRCFDAAGEKVTSRRGAAAIEAEARTRAKIAGKVPSTNALTLLQVVTALSQTWQHAADWPNKRRYAREILSFFGPNTPMRAIDGARIQDLIAHLASQPRQVWTGGSRRRDDPHADEFWKPDPKGRTRSPATVNRYLPVLRMALERAHATRDPVTHARVIEEVPRVADLTEPKRRARPTPDAVIGRLFEILPEHVTDAIQATLYFGFRRSEIFGLQIRHVDFEARGIRLFADEVKDHEDAFLPGGAEAMTFLTMLVERAKARKTPYLITWRPPRKDPVEQAAEPWRPIKQPRYVWRKAMEIIEAEFGARWRWHDLRAAFITYVAINSGAVAAQKMARHSNFATTQGYVDVAESVTRAAAEAVADRPLLRAIRGGK